MCTEEAAGVSVQQNTRSLEDAETGDQDKGSMAEAAVPAAGSRAGEDAMTRSPAAGHAKGGSAPETDVLFWPLQHLASPRQNSPTTSRGPEHPPHTARSSCFCFRVSGCKLISHQLPAHTCFCG